MPIDRDLIYRTNTDVTSPWLKWLYSSTDVCIYCGHHFSSSDSFPFIKTIDHIKPLKYGGKHRMKNLRVICWKCNNSKKALFEADYLEKKVFSGVKVESVKKGIITIIIG